MDDILACNNCIATNQMRSSRHCTKNVIRNDNSFVPECFINSKAVAQSERNYLMCPTYNLGMFEVCQTCPLDCIKNPNKQSNSSIADVLNMLGGLFNFDETKKQSISNTIDKLNTPDFKEIYTSLESVSDIVKEMLNGKNQSSDLTKKILESETNKIKNTVDKMVKGGKITSEEVELFKQEINTSMDIQKIKKMLNTIKAS